MHRHFMQAFHKFIAQKSFLQPDTLFFDEQISQDALSLTVKDVHYHFKNISQDEIVKRIHSNSNELAIYLFRLGNLIFTKNSDSASLNVIHWLMKELCCCEIYYSNTIGEGLYITHGNGTVIGSRNLIGKGFKIYQNCTVGHSIKNGPGNVIGNNVTCYAGAKIIGSLTIGDNVIIGANAVVTKNITANTVAYGYPLSLKPLLPTTKIV